MLDTHKVAHNTGKITARGRNYMDKANEVSNLQALARKMVGKQLITNEEFQAGLSDIINTFAQYRSATSEINKETKETLNLIVKQVNEAHQEMVKEMEGRGDMRDKKMMSEMGEMMKKMNAVHKEMMAMVEMKPKNGKDGKDADPEVVMKMVLDKIPPQEEVTGEMMVDKINALSTTPENQIDAKHIKNLPTVTEKVGGGLTRGVADKLYAPIGTSGATLQTDGVDNGDQTLLNLAAGTNITLTDDGSGTVTIDATGTGAVDSVNGATGVVVLDTDDISEGTTNKYATAAEKAKLANISVTQAVDLDTIESDTATNNAKVTNATHTGDVTGATSLTIDKTAITGKTAATMVGTDYVLFSDTSDTGSLKKGLLSDIMGVGATAWGAITGTLADQTDLQTALDGKQATITGLTASGAELNILDGATLTTAELNYVDGVTSAIQTQLDGKVDENVAIVGATKTKITYDAKGLVTAGADATTADIADSLNKRYVTDAQLTVIGNTSGTNTGDQDLSTLVPKTTTVNTKALSGNITLNQDDVGDGTTYKQYSATEKTKLAGIETAADVTDAGNVGSSIHGATAKVTPVDADTVPLIDSEALNVLKKVTWANIKATLKTYLDTLYAPVLGADDNYVTDAEKTKLSNISITQAVDLDALETASHAAVTKAGTATYISLSGQQITADPIDTTDLAAGVLDTDLSAVSLADDTIPSAKATKAALDGKQATITDASLSVGRLEATSPTIIGKASGGTGSAVELTPTQARDTLSLGTANSPQFTGIELGHASDTTLSRAAAGDVAVEGVSVLTTSNTKTATNKRIQPRTASSTSNASLTPDVSSANVYFRTTQTVGLTIGAPTGTPVIGETILIYVDSAASQTLTINSTYKAFGAAFPASTTAGKTFMMSCQYSGTDWKTLWANAV